MGRLRKTFVVGLSVVAFLLVAATSRAQVVSGSVSGSVVDQSTAAVPGATVTITDLDTGATTRGTTTDTGFFRFVLLPIGTYEVKVSKSGFREVKLDGIKVNANAEYATGVLKLEVGSTTSVVEVSAAPPMIESSQAQVTTAITGQELATFSGIAENQGMDFLALEVPGVVGMRSDENFSNTNGVGFSVNGLRGRSNDQQIDGQNNNDNSVTGPGLFLSNPDFVQEYQITTSNFGAEYGRNSGSVVNINTKSGTNSWHGTISATETNSVLTSLSNVEKDLDDLTKPPRFNNEFSGGTIGGPLVKNRVFIFGGFDDQIDSSSGVFSTGALSPTPTGVGQLASCFPGSTSVQALQTFGPFAVGGGNPTPVGTPSTAYYDNAPVNNTTDPTTGAPACGYQLNGITRTLPNGFHEWDWVTRLDVQFNSANAVFVRYLFQKQNFFNGIGGANGYPVSIPSLTQTVLGQWAHTFSSSLVNEFRFGYSHSNVQFGGNTIGDTVPLQTNIGDALASIGFSSSALLGFGPASNFPQGRIVKTYQAQDNFDFTRGHHQFKTGVNFTSQHSPNVFLPNYNGAYTFTDWGAYAANTPSSVSVTDGSPSFAFKEYDTFGYFADDWKIKNNLTLNLGLTYSYYGQPANLFNQLTTAQQKSSAPFWDPTLPTSATTVPPTSSVKDLFGPSVGFAWSPNGRLFGNGKTVIRGGYRLVYDGAYYNTFLLVAISAPTVLAQTLQNPTAGVLANPIGTNVRKEYASDLTLGTFDPRNFDRTTVAPSFGPDRVHEWSFGIERQITSKAAFEARYVGNHGFDLYQSINANPYIAGLAASYPNLVPSGVTPCTTPLATVPNAAGTVNCSEGVTDQTANSGFSNYNAVQLEFRTTNLANQLTMKMGYTYSKTQDNVSEIFSTFAGSNSIAYSQNPLNFKGQEYGLSGLDTPNVWTVTFVEDIPFMRSQHGVLGHILGGWVLSGNYILGSGEPYTPSQEFANYFSGGVANDTSFDLANIGTFETSRPFVGNLNAPSRLVGIYAGDSCAGYGVGCAVAANTLISLNDIGAATAAGTTPPVDPVTKSQVRFIVNGAEADSIFGTPFGNAGRNSAREFWTNSGNFTLYKNIRFWERVNLQWHMTMTNVFNHANYSGINPFVENAGNPGYFSGFANPFLQTGSIRTIYFGLKIVF